MSERTSDLIMKKVLGKVCERHTDACSLIHDFANGKRSTDDVSQDVEGFICSDKNQDECDQEFDNLVKEVKSEDYELYGNE